MSQIIDIVGKFKDKLKIRLDKVYIENRVFRLFSRVTVCCLFFCTGLVTMKTLIGEHIKCILPPKEDIRPEALNQYCFIMSTYTIPHLYNLTVGVDIPHFGVGPHDPEKDEQKYHAYYQWVPFVLFFQAMIFLLPHYIWKSFESGRLQAYCNLELADKIPMKSRSLKLYEDSTKKGDIDKMINRAAVYFSDNMDYNRLYASMYIFAEVLNFAIVVSNIFLTDRFLGYEFTKYGHEVLNFVNDDPENRIDPMDRVFPKVTKCDFHKYGPSGNLIRYDIMCVLALNIVNEKIYTFLWFWFILLSVVGGLALVYRVVVVCIPNLRNAIIKRKTTRHDDDALEFICGKIGYCDWFVLKRISDNINKIRFGELCQGIQHVLKEKPHMGRTSMSPPPYGGSKLDKDDLDGKALLTPQFVNI